ncbi:DUF721 domain-containing protein [Ruegeria atlantica]|uniref:DUF721 domain-containing protein n=1 Tax=Ruegeria atlantica TaxID=81569 RepID=UPI00147D00F7|nr:DciA family protein [Ruegeria atlantica]
MQRRRSSTRGFKRTATLLNGQIRRAGESRGFAVSRLLTHWAEIVGQDMAAIARPVNVGYGKGGIGATLTVLTTGPQAPMLEMQKEQLRSKVNAVYGYNAISRVRITQTAPTGFAEGQASFDHKPKSAKPKIDPEIEAEADRTARDVHDGELRAALERLGRNVLSKQKR